MIRIDRPWLPSERPVVHTDHAHREVRELIIREPNSGLFRVEQTSILIQALADSQITLLYPTAIKPARTKFRWEHVLFFMGLKKEGDQLPSIGVGYITPPSNMRDPDSCEVAFHALRNRDADQVENLARAIAVLCRICSGGTSATQLMAQVCQAVESPQHGSSVRASPEISKLRLDLGQLEVPRYAKKVFKRLQRYGWDVPQVSRFEQMLAPRLESANMPDRQPETLGPIERLQTPVLRPSVRAAWWETIIGAVLTRWKLKRESLEERGFVGGLESFPDSGRAGLFNMFTRIMEGSEVFGESLDIDNQLRDPGDAKARTVSEIIQEVRPAIEQGSALIQDAFDRSSPFRTRANNFIGGSEKLIVGLEQMYGVCARGARTLYTLRERTPSQNQMLTTLVELEQHSKNALKRLAKAIEDHLADFYVVLNNLPKS